MKIEEIKSLLPVDLNLTIEDLDEINLALTSSEIGTKQNLTGKVLIEILTKYYGHEYIQEHNPGWYKVLSKRTFNVSTGKLYMVNINPVAINLPY